MQPLTQISRDTDIDYESYRQYEPFQIICDKFNFPQIGNQYVILNRKNLFLSLGPHWTGPFYVSGLDIMFTLFYRSTFAPGIHPAFGVISIILCILVLVFLFMTACSGMMCCMLWLGWLDPGISSRNHLPTQEINAADNRPYCGTYSLSCHVILSP